LPAAKLFDFTTKHAAELGLTSEQKTKLEGWVKEMQAEREKVRADADMQALLKEQTEAREAHDQARLKEATKKVRARREELGLAARPWTTQHVLDMLTPEQQQKLRALLDAKKNARGDAPAP
jgi:Spy/CpxP family protein refolding chaperone